MAVHYYLSKKIDRNGEAPIQVTISLKGVRLQTSVRHSIPATKWLAETERVRKGCTNRLITYLRTMIPSTAIDCIITDYHIASTQDQAIIFLQLDTAGQCRTGKIMHYNPSTGKRIKDETIPGRINWFHTTLKRRHQLPKDWQLTQCLFGEHLLPSTPTKPSPS